jgi:hypothetical protein
MKLVIIFLAFLFIVTLSFVYFSEPYITIKSEDVPKVEFPFKNLFDDNGKKLNIILIAAPFREAKHEELYEEYKKKGLLFCGISSYLDFPNKIHNPYEDKYHEERSHNYVDMVDAWLTCFRIPAYNNTIKKIPNMLLTEADLKDIKNTPVPTDPKEYDFLYCCLSDNDQCTPGWQSYNRNWDLAKKCLEVMCSRGLRGILVGRQNCEFTTKCNGIVKVFDFLPYHEFQTQMKKCRFLFIPNISDASPRVITEAICYNMPVLVNENILGGWHNIIPSVTGEFFSSEKDISTALDKLYSPNASYTPRKWFEENRGKEISGAKLAEFLIKVYNKDINNKNMKYATITI